MKSEIDLDDIHKKAVKVLALEKGGESSSDLIHSYNFSLEGIPTLSPNQIVEYTEYVLSRGLPVNLRKKFIEQFLDQLECDPNITREIYDKIEDILQLATTKYNSIRRYSKDEHVLGRSINK